jgi:hypothetical protein
MPRTDVNTSHTKKKRTRKDSPSRSLHTEADRRALFTTTSPSVITSPVVTQTQGADATEESLTEHLPQPNTAVMMSKPVQTYAFITVFQ